MRVPFSRWMAFAVTAISISAISSTGCTTMGRAPGAGWMSSWWHKTPSESYASRTPTPSEKSTPIPIASLGNASSAPKDPTITPYDGRGTVGSAQPSGGYPTQPAGAIQPNYATTGAANAGGGYGSYQVTTGTQVAPAGGAGFGAAGGGSSVYANAAPQTSPYATPYGGAPSYETADARNSSWGGSAAPAPNYGTAPQTSSSIQPYNGYQGGSAQPYGNPTPPPSYTPPATNYAPSGGGYGGGYGAATTPSSTAPMSQPPSEGYAPGSTSRYYADSQQPAPVENANGMFDDQSVAPAGYQQGPAANGAYNAGGNYGGSTQAAPAAGGYPYP